ncbi:MAG: oligosaccharide flippase family protein, partial [Bacteroidota bacterium]|nr:oligosaccharide flippase family protein [Bacteroidota bacterium]
MLKKFLSGLGLLLTLNLLIKPVWIFGIDRTVQNITGTDYGFYYTILNFSFLFSILLDFGITSFNNRQISQNNDLLREHFSGMLAVKLVLAVIYMIVVLFAGIMIGFDSRQMHLLLLLGAVQFLSSLILYLRSNISALMLFKTESLFSVMDKLLMIGICSVLIWGHPAEGVFRIEWFVYAQLVAYCLTALSAFFVVLHHSAGFRFNFSPRFSISIIKQGLPYAMLVLLMMFFSRLDTVMLERMLPDGDKQVAIYANGYRLLDAANNIPYLFSVLLLPLFSKMLADRSDVSQIVRVSLALLVPLAVMTASISLFYSSLIMDLLYVSHIQQSAAVFGILMFSFVANTLLYVFGTLLTANGSVQLQNKLMITALLLNVGLNLWLIPLYKVIGAAWAGVITQGFVAIAEMILALKLIRIHPGARFLPALLLFTLAVFLLSFVMR